MLRQLAHPLKTKPRHRLDIPQRRAQRVRPCRLSVDSEIPPPRGDQPRPLHIEFDKESEQAKQRIQDGGSQKADERNAHLQGQFYWQQIHAGGAGHLQPESGCSGWRSTLHNPHLLKADSNSHRPERPLLINPLRMHVIIPRINPGHKIVNKGLGAGVHSASKQPIEHDKQPIPAVHWPAEAPKSTAE